MSDANKKYRLITRSDFDGVVSAVLLKELDMIDEILFVHPKDVQDGKVEVCDRDILANLPYIEGAALIFDHHISETMRVYDSPENHIIEGEAPSAARVIYNYYGGKLKFPHISQEMMKAVDKCDSAQFTIDDILHPQGWVLLSFLMDSRTGLGRFREFTVSNYALMMELVEACQTLSIEQIMELPNVKERIDMYFVQQKIFTKQIEHCAEVYDKLVVINLQNEETIYAGNRFMVYALYPDCNISMHQMWGRQQQNTVFAVGKSVLNRTCNLNIGELMLKYEGGGHANAGTCQIDVQDSDRVKQELIDIITKYNNVESTPLSL
ncbi:exopolyphosphatase [Pseudanabaena mucicola]|uniref:Exopolyphosphatase n=1 Tax=Pseudanabaena mucicola FACHB-723 TaxID=2692860 RepID=A0ABR7ZVY7_9CYAN|nr:exopolyphosphatase [Pseudanabaena mucicola]MBD2187930.1 exopolyphosphatase [Pseudanabaena mucicola FACHB-723]